MRPIIKCQINNFFLRGYFPNTFRKKLHYPLGSFDKIKHSDNLLEDSLKIKDNEE